MVSPGWEVFSDKLLGPYFDGFKRYTLDKTDVLCIVDLGMNQVFKDPNVFTALLFLQRTLYGKHCCNAPTRFVRVSDLELFPDSISYEFLDQKTLESLRWSPVSSLEARLLDTGLTLGEIAWVKDVGLNYWTKGRGKVRGGSIADRILYDDQQQHPRDKPYLKGRDISRYSLIFGNHWLRHDYNRRLNPEVDTFRYSPEYLEREKIVYRQTADRIIAAFEPHGMLIDKTLHTIVLKEEWEQALHPYYLLGLLNSSLLTYLYRAMSREEGRTFAQVKIFRMRQLPIQAVVPIDPASVARHDRMVTLVEHMLALHQALSSACAAKKTDPERQIADTDAEIDALVYELYGLTAEEIALVEDSING